MSKLTAIEWLRRQDADLADEFLRRVDAEFAAMDKRAERRIRREWAAAKREVAALMNRP